MEGVHDVVKKELALHRSVESLLSGAHCGNGLRTGMAHLVLSGFGHNPVGRERTSFSTSTPGTLQFSRFPSSYSLIHDQLLGGEPEPPGGWNCI